VLGSPRHILTSGIFSTASGRHCGRTGSRARWKKSERRAFIESVLPGLIRYHQWWYRQRDPAAPASWY